MKITIETKIKAIFSIFNELKMKHRIKLANDYKYSIIHLEWLLRLWADGHNIISSSNLIFLNKVWDSYRNLNNTHLVNNVHTIISIDVIERTISYIKNDT